MQATLSVLRKVSIGRSARAARLTVLAFLACSAFAVLPVAAQATSSGLSNAGTEFWLGFPTNYGGGTQLTLYVTGSTATTGTVTVPGEAFSEAFSVTPGSVTAVKLPSGAQMATSDGTEEKAIHVTAGA